MATATTATAKPAETAPASGGGPRPYRVTLALYDRMIASGVLDRVPVFLWRGQLFEKMTKGWKHNQAAAGLTMALVQTVPPGWHVRVEQPVRIPDDGAPEPDFSVVRGGLRDFDNRDVTVSDVALVVEVADSSLKYDTRGVLEDFAREGVPVYWVVNIPGRTVDVYTRPTGPREAGPPFYAERRSYGPGEEVPLVLDGREVGRVVVEDVLR